MIRLGKTGFQTSPIGFGTYRVDNSHPEHREALKLALLSGCNLIDTSANYGDGEAEILIGNVIEELSASKQIERNKLILVTKAGYIQGSNMKLGPFPDTVKVAPDCWHSISPEFLEDQLTRSLKRLRVNTVDIFLLHNPEYFLKAGGDHREYYARIKKAFHYLETEVARGRIRYFGVSSNTLPEPKDSPEFTSLEQLLEIAKTTPHFAVIEFPFNLFEPGAYLEKNNSNLTVLQLAEKSDLGVLTNRPLNAFYGSELLRLAYPPEVPSHTLRELEEILSGALSDAMQLETAYAWEDVISIKEIAWGHVLRHNLQNIHSLENWNTLLLRRIRPTLSAALKKLESTPDALPWVDEYQFRLEELFSSVSAYFSGRQADRAAALSDALDELSSDLLPMKSLSQKALALYSAVPGIQAVLVGMRKTEYVRDAMAVKTAEKHGVEHVFVEISDQADDILTQKS